MKKNAVVFTISSDLTFAVANLLLDIKKISPQLADEVVVLHNGIKDKDLALLNKIFPIKAIEYKIPVRDLSKFNQDTLNYFTVMAYAKFECLKLLAEYKNVIYLDPDMVILKDISCLLEKCESGIKMMPSGQTVSAQLHSDVDEYDMKREGICGCIFVFQDHANYIELYDFCISALNLYASKLKLAEQAIFDFMIQKFHIEICPIDRNVYSPHPRELQHTPNAKVLHAYGQPKFWNGLHNAQWNKNYMIWLEMGGTKYNSHKIKKVVQKSKHFIKQFLLIPIAKLLKI